jgi:hypothetical protein
MEPVSDTDALLLTDTTQRTIFRFHRNDLYNTLLFNLALTSNMLPTPRAPSNPWTNKPLTYGQTMAVCLALLRDYAVRGICPPPLFALFWEARFHLPTFERIAAPTLGYYAICSYFKDVGSHNYDFITATIQNLLTQAGYFITEAVLAQWIRAQELTATQREWVALVRDYMIYKNLHIQVRPLWYGVAGILDDVRELYARSEDLKTLALGWGNSTDGMDLFDTYLYYLVSGSATTSGLTTYQILSSSFLTYQDDDDDVPGLLPADEMTGIGLPNEPESPSLP